MERTRFTLSDDQIPRAFYNISADLPSPPPPPLHPGTGQPIGPQDLAPLFPMELIKQVVSTDRDALIQSIRSSLGQECRLLPPLPSERRPP